jgi:hypothetical protein
MKFKERMLIETKYYHGSDNDNIQSFKVEDGKFQLLGPGVYLD